MPGAFLPHSPEAPSAELTHKVVRGTVWNVAGTIVRQGIRFAATVVVANKLTESDYAVAALALTIMGIFYELTAQGFALALVQRKDLDDITKHSVFWPMVLGGIVLAGVIIALSGWFSRFYGDEALRPVLAVLAVGLATSMIGAVPNALLQREMRFRQINIISVAGGLLSALLGIGLAVAGLGYWALIAPTAGVMIFQAAGAFIISGYRPRFAFSPAALRSVSTFGLVLLAGGLIRYLSDNADYMIMGKFWELPLLGLYYFAFERAQQPFFLVLAQLRSVLFPALSSIQDDPTQLRLMFLRATKAVCLVLFPLYVLLIGVADWLIPWLFSGKWAPAVRVFQIFALFTFLRAVISFVPSTLLAINRPKVNLAFAIFRICVVLPALFILGSLGAGIETTATVLVIIWYIQSPFYLGYMMRLIKLPLRELWIWLRRSLGGAVLTAAALVAARLLLGAAGVPFWAEVAVSVAAGAGVYMAVCWKDVKRTIEVVLARR